MKQPGRLEQINRCMHELALVQAGFKTAKVYEKLGWLQGQMDWLEELYRLLHEWEGN